MENFKPPAMQEVEVQKKKRRAVWVIVVILIVAGMGVGSFYGAKRLKLYLNYLSVERRHQLLNDYYKSLVNKDETVRQAIAPDVNLSSDYAFINTEGDYALYIYPDLSTNSNELLYMIVDESVVPNIPHLKQVFYSEGERNNVTIERIKEIGSGNRIH